MAVCWEVKTGLIFGDSGGKEQLETFMVPESWKMCLFGKDDNLMND